MKVPHKTISRILDRHRDQLGKDFEKYKNHVCRVFLLCQTLDAVTDNHEKYAIAAAFHDLGIWTDNTFDYLAPSIELAKRFLFEINQQEWTAEVSLMIEMHHKRSTYEGAYAKTVETFRRADWIDVTKGLYKFNLQNIDIRHSTKAYPTLGFHGFLMKQAIKNFFKHPLHPLPMFKK